MLFLADDAAAPSVSYKHLATGDFSAAYRSVRVAIGDARRAMPRLDVEGFALVKHRSAVRDFRDDAEALDLGRSEAAEIVARATGSDWVLVFDHTVRRRAPDAARQPSTGGTTRRDLHEALLPARTVRGRTGKERSGL